MRKRRPLTLLEISVALFLAGILLTTVIQFFHEYSQTESKIKAIKKTVLTRATLQLRLNQLFSGGENFYTNIYEDSSSPALFFTVDGGLENAVLYLNNNKELILDIYGRKDPLLPNISSAAFRFFDAEEWVDTWDKEEGNHPLMLTLSLQEKNTKEPLVFSFFFPSDKPITYQRKP